MANFDKYSNYTEESSFSSVVFGSDKPLLEVELNEVQQIINSKFTKIMKVLGVKILFLKDPTYSDGILTIDSALVFEENGGYMFEIKQASIECGADNEIFLQIEEKVVDHTTELHSYGNSVSDIIANHIKDNRYPIETTKRKCVTYTLMADVSIPNDTDTIKYLKVAKVEGENIVYADSSNTESFLAQAKRSVISEFGVHDIRYKDEALQICVDGEWKNIVLPTTDLTKEDVDEIIDGLEIDYDGENGGIDGVTKLQQAIDKVNDKTEILENTLGYIKKNLLKLAGSVGNTLTANSVTINKTGKNTYSLSGTSTKDTWFELGYEFRVDTVAQENYFIELDKNKTYCASARVSGTITSSENIPSVRLHSHTSITPIISLAENLNSMTFTNEDGLTRIWIYIPSGVTFSNVTLKLQLEEGAEVTDFEEYVEDVKTRVNRLYDVEKISIDEIFTSSTTNANIWTYTAGKKCLLNLSVTFGNYEGRPIDVRGYVVGNERPFVWQRNTSDGGSSMCIPVNIVLEKGKQVLITCAYNNATTNRYFIEGYKQFLE